MDRLRRVSVVFLAGLLLLASLPALTTNSREQVEAFLENLGKKHKGDPRFTGMLCNQLGKCVYIRLDRESPTRQVMDWTGPKDKYPDSLCFAALTPTRLLVWKGNLNHFHSDGEVRLDFTEWALADTVVEERWSDNYRTFHLALVDRITGARWEADPAPNWNPYVPDIRRAIAKRRRQQEFLRWTLPIIAVSISVGSVLVSMIALVLAGRRLSPRP
jgi:hypothetical protein